MPLILSSQSAIVFSELDLVITKDSPIFVEDEIEEFDCIKNAIDKNIIQKNYTKIYTGLPVVYCFSTKQERELKIKEKKQEQQKLLQFYKEREELNKLTVKSAGVETCGLMEFTCGVKIKLGFGIALFDGDLPHYEDSMRYLYDIMESKEFREYAISLRVFVTEYIAEDCQQKWLIDGNKYIETNHTEFLNDNFINKPNPSNLNVVYKELSKIVKEKYQLDMPVIEPAWMLHLYYE